MSDILRTEKFPEDTNTIDLLISSHRSLRKFAISHTVKVLQIKLKAVLQMFYGYYAWIDPVRPMYIN